MNVFLRDGDTVYRTWQDSPDGWPKSATYSNWLDSPDAAWFYGPNGELQ